MLNGAARVALAAAVVLLSCACGSSGSKQGAQKAGNGPVAVNKFVVDQDGGRGIFRRDPDGKLRGLTTNPRDYFPTWSRGGERIAFSRPFSKDGESHLFFMNGDGSDVRQVPGAVIDGSAFDWGPDDEIVFGNGKGIAVVKADGTGLKQLVADGTEPAWSPDGQTIVFRRPPGLVAMHADGSDVHPFVQPPATSENHIYTLSGAAWSRDGKHLAFLQTDLFGLTKTFPTTVEIVNPDGSGRRTLTKVSFSPSEAVHPTWSRDGGSIAYADRRGYTYGIWVVPSKGGKPSRLLEGDYQMPSWAPAGA